MRLLDNKIWRTFYAMLTTDNQGNVRAIEKVVWSCTVAWVLAGTTANGLSKFNITKLSSQDVTKKKNR